MRQNKKLLIDEKEYKIVSDATVLELCSPGRAIITVQSSEELSGTVKFYIGEGEEIKLYFTGYIEESTSLDGKQERLKIVEMSHLLEYNFPFTLRHVTAHEILEKMSELYGLSFKNEVNASFNVNKIPQCINHGSGASLLNWLGRECEAENYIWQAEQDGTVYVGSWDKSFYGGVVQNLPSSFFTKITVLGANCPIIDWMRPGVCMKIDGGEKRWITKVELGDNMRLSWSENPWNKQFRRIAG